MYLEVLKELKSLAAILFHLYLQKNSSIVEAYHWLPSQPLPNIQIDIIDSLLSNVSKGLVYVTLVEESFNVVDDYVSIQKAAKMLRLGVEVYNKWLGNKLQKLAPQLNTVRQILQWFSDTAKNMVTEVEITNVGIRNDDSMYRSIFYRFNVAYHQSNPDFLPHQH